MIDKVATMAGQKVIVYDTLFGVSEAECL